MKVIAVESAVDSYIQCCRSVKSQSAVQVLLLAMAEGYGSFWNKVIDSYTQLPYLDYFFM